MVILVFVFLLLSTFNQNLRLLLKASLFQKSKDQTYESLEYLNQNHTCGEVSEDGLKWTCFNNNQFIAVNEE